MSFEINFYTHTQNGFETQNKIDSRNALKIIIKERLIV